MLSDAAGVWARFDAGRAGVVQHEERAEFVADSVGREQVADVEAVSYPVGGAGVVDFEDFLGGRHCASNIIFIWRCFVSRKDSGDGPLWVSSDL